MLSNVGQEVHKCSSCLERFLTHTHSYPSRQTDVIREGTPF